LKSKYIFFNLTKDTIKTVKLPPMSDGSNSFEGIKVTATGFGRLEDGSLKI
jgi:hypothetical protein